MITLYLLKNCKHCTKIIEYINKNPNLNICAILISKNDISNIKNNEPRITEFPVAFGGTPKKNGLPYKNSAMISGSNNILNVLQNSFGQTLKGNQIEINYKNNNEGNITNLKQYNKNCFGKSNVDLHVMDRPYGPCDTKFLLQGFQPPNARPKRPVLPVKFGMTTPGTPEWNAERELSKRMAQELDRPIIRNDSNCEQEMYANQIAHINYPRTYSNDYLNRLGRETQKLNFGKAERGRRAAKAIAAKASPTARTDGRSNFGNRFIDGQTSLKLGRRSSASGTNRFGQMVSGQVNDNAPFLTYAAGGNTISRVSGKNYLPEQIPIQIQNSKNSYINGNLQEYALKNADKLKLLSKGMSNKWTFNNQGLNNYGKGLKEKGLKERKNSKKIKEIKKDTKPPPQKETKPHKETKKQMKFTSPLGIEITF